MWLAPCYRSRVNNNSQPSQDVSALSQFLIVRNALVIVFSPKYFSIIWIEQVTTHKSAEIIHFSFRPCSGRHSVWTDRLDNQLNNNMDLMFDSFFYRNNIPEGWRWPNYGVADWAGWSATTISATATRRCANGDVPCMSSNDRYIKQTRATRRQVSSVPRGDGKFTFTIHILMRHATCILAAAN